MLSRLRDHWVYGGFLAALLLLVLTPVLSADWSTPLLLVWLQLPVYMLHQFDEHDADRFRHGVNQSVGGGREVLSRLDVAVINIAGVWGLDALVFSLAARVDLGVGLMAVYLSLVNGLAHLGQAIVLRRSNPGLWTSVLLFLPLGVTTLVVFRGVPGVTMGHHLLGLIVALLFHGLIVARILWRKARLQPDGNRPGKQR